MRNIPPRPSRVRCRPGHRSGGPNGTGGGPGGESPAFAGVARVSRASPSAHPVGATETKERSMPQSTSAPVRDLGSHELWEASLERSRHRRRLFEDIRRRRNRQRGASVVLSAGLLGPTASPALAAAAMGGQAGADDGGTDNATALTAASQGAQLVGFGSRGPAVAAVQSKLRSTLPSILVDGIFGPQTEGAVRAYQRAHGLPVTGRVDARTWSALFRAGVVFYDGRSAAEKAREAVAPPKQQKLQIAGDAAAANVKLNASAPAPSPAPATSARKAVSSSPASVPAPEPAGTPAQSS